MNDTSKSELKKWWINKKINPFTRRKIKKGGKVFKKLLKECLISKSIDSGYYRFRKNKIDPLILVDVPIKKNKPLFKYSYCWEPYNGEIISEDPRGPLYFDPDTLVHYFYTNRLRYLWNDGDGLFTGNYGDALGNGPEFNISGRGPSPHYYLFRIPLDDAFCDDISKQQITIAPKLSLEDIIKINNLAKKYGDNYKNIYGIDRPDLIKIYDLYHEAIKGFSEFSNDENLFYSQEELKNSIYLFNKFAVDKLKEL